MSNRSDGSQVHCTTHSSLWADLGTILNLSSVVSRVRTISDEAMDPEEEEFDLDMDIVEAPLTRPQVILRKKGTMLKCVHDLFVRASKNLSPEESAKVKELLVKQ